jgi:hypothetical protein
VSVVKTVPKLTALSWLRFGDKPVRVFTIDSRPGTVARTPQYQVGKRRGTFDCLKPKRPFERGARITQNILRAIRRHD